MLFNKFEKIRCLFVLALFAISAPIWAQEVVMPAAGQLICCNAESGQRVCSDITPPQCNGRLLKIYNRNGVLVREVAARLTPEEKARADEQARLERQVQEAIHEQRRKDQALLATYSRLEDIDRAQKRREGEIEAAIQNTRSLLEATKARNEEFEIKAQNTLLTAKQKELEQARKKFAEDRQRYIELTNKANNKRRD
jgi:hypothetical protein